MPKVFKLQSTQSFKKNLANLGYSAASAFADLLDNSWDARSRDSVSVEIRFYYSNGKVLAVEIQDDGEGMSKATLQKIASPGVSLGKCNHSLGKFGAGLKLAGFAMAHRLSIASRTSTNRPSGIAMTNEQFSRDTCEELLPEEIESEFGRSCLKEGSGTIVRLSDLREGPIPAPPLKPAVTKFATNLIDRLGLTYHRLIATNRMKVLIREIWITRSGQREEAVMPVLPINPFGGARGNGQWPKEIELTVKKCKVKLRFHVWHRNSTKDSGYLLKGLGGAAGGQGFYFYRNDRLISYGGWCGIRNNETHMHLARISVDLPAEADQLFQLTIMKNRVDLPIEIKNALQQSGSHAEALWSEFMLAGSQRGQKSHAKRDSEASCIVAGKGFPGWLRRRTRTNARSAGVSAPSMLRIRISSVERIGFDGATVLLPRALGRKLTDVTKALLFRMLIPYADRVRNSEDLNDTLDFIENALSR